MNSVEIKVCNEWLNLETGKYECPLCRKQYSKMGISSHIWRAHGDGNKFVSNKSGKTNSTWMKGKTYSEIYGDRSNDIKKKLSDSHVGEKSWWYGKQHTDETKLLIAISTIKRTKGSFGRQGFYKGIKCDSSWELAFVMYNLDHNIEFKRNEEYFEYFDVNGKKHLYFPDFVLSDGTYVEIKGYMHDGAKHKLNEFSKAHKLMILGANEIQIYLMYVKNMYGKDFVKYYEPL